MVVVLWLWIVIYNKWPWKWRRWRQTSFRSMDLHRLGQRIVRFAIHIKTNNGGSGPSAHSLGKFLKADRSLLSGRSIHPFPHVSVPRVSLDKKRERSNGSKVMGLISREYKYWSYIKPECIHRKPVWIICQAYLWKSLTMCNLLFKRSDVLLLLKHKTANWNNMDYLRVLWGQWQLSHCQ